MLRLRVCLTGYVITQYPAGDDVPTGGEKSLKVRLSHVLREAGHVEVGALDGLTAGPGKRDLKDKIGQTGQGRAGEGQLTFIVLFCNLNPFRVWIALEASSCL